MDHKQQIALALAAVLLFSTISALSQSSLVKTSVAQESFDFSISTSPASVILRPGDSAEIMVTVSLLSGTAQPVSLQYDFPPILRPYIEHLDITKWSGIPPFSSVLTFKISSNAPDEFGRLRISGHGGGMVHATEVRLVLEELSGKPTWFVSYEFSNGRIKSTSIDREFKSLFISLDTDPTRDGKLEITLPRELIDRKIGTADDPFVILIDGNDARFDETQTTTKERTLKITIPAGSREIWISGTQASSGTVIVEEMKDVSKTPIPPTTVGGEGKVVRKSGIIFDVPDELQPAVVGKHYSYSFCLPEPTSDLLCGGLIEQDLKRPIGGVQPFTFMKETLLEIHGNIPFGLTLHPNGVLEGTPIKQDAGKTFKFKVCAIDNTRSFVCEETSLRVVEEVEPGQIGGSLKYRVTYQANIKYYSLAYTGTIKHEISSDVTLTEVKPGLFIQRSELTSMDEWLFYFYAPMKTVITVSWTPESNCVGPPVSLTYEGQALISMVYYENLDLLEVINIDWNSPEREYGEGCSAEDLIWESSLREGPGQLEPGGLNLKTGLRQEKLSEEKTRQLDEYLSVLTGTPQIFPEEVKGLFFDINGGTITGEWAHDSVLFQSATLTVTLISAEKAAEEPSPPLVKEEPSGPPTTLSGDVKSWTVEGGEEGTICNPVIHPDSPCKELSGPVQQGDIIKTGADNYGKIPLHNGRSTILLGPNTILKVFKISEDEAIFVFFNLPYKVRALLDAPQGVKTLFSISGCSYVEPDPGSIETYADLWKITEREERCSVAPAEFFFLITGTEFTFEQQSDKTTRLTVLEGEVQVWKPADQGVIVTVGTNQQLVLEVDAPLVPSSIDPASIDRWWIEAEAAQPEQITPPSGGGCLIATAAFGSELTPQVQFLRNFRDEHILSTLAGSSFMNVFNTWYYSFSPNVASAEREIPVLQQTIKYAIYPLLGILTVAEKAYSIFNGEIGAITAGFVTSSMIGFVYFWPIAYAITKVRRRFSSNVLIYPVLVSLVGVIAGILISDPILLMITTSAFVLTVVGISAILSSKLISKIIRK